MEILVATGGVVVTVRVVVGALVVGTGVVVVDVVRVGVVVVDVVRIGVVVVDVDTAHLFLHATQQDTHRSSSTQK